MTDGDTTDNPTPTSVVPARPHRRRRQILISLGVVVALLVVSASAFGVYAYQHLGGNITTIDDVQVQEDRPAAIAPSVEAAKTPLNILLIGSDTREGDNGFIGGAAGPGLSDTTMLLHVSADRSRALAVSIPRDSMVDMPSCQTPQGATVAPAFRQFNSAYSLGGASCVRRTVEQLTDIRIDHFVVVDFSGFRGMVNALGGVKVNIPEAIDDGLGITFNAGCQTLNGDESLKYVRVRHIGSGSDPERLGRQQAFLSSVIQKVTSKGTLTNPVKLYSFLDAATKSLATDKQLNSVPSLAALAQDLRTVGLDRIEFLTIPYERYEPDPNRLQWSAAADECGRRSARTSLCPARARRSTRRAPRPLPRTTPGHGTGLDQRPGAQRHRHPGCGRGSRRRADRAGLQRRWLRHGADEDQDHRSLVEPRDESARTLSRATGAPTREVQGLGQIVELVIGTDYQGVEAVTVSPSTSPSPSPTFETRKASKAIC